MTYDVHQYASKGFRPLVAVVAEHAASHPDGVAMRQKRHGIWQELTWSGLEDVTHALAAGLIEMGAGPGTHLGILSENRQEWVLAQFGIQAAGGTTVGMYPTSPAAEIDHLVNASDTEILFIEDQEQFDKIVALSGKLPKLRKLIVFEPKGLEGRDLPRPDTFRRIACRWTRRVIRPTRDSPSPHQGAQRGRHRDDGLHLRLHRFAQSRPRSATPICTAAAWPRCPIFRRLPPGTNHPELPAPVPYRRAERDRGEFAIGPVYHEFWRKPAHHHPRFARRGSADFLRRAKDLGEDASGRHGPSPDRLAPAPQADPAGPEVCRRARQDPARRLGVARKS